MTCLANNYITPLPTSLLERKKGKIALSVLKLYINEIESCLKIPNYERNVKLMNEITKDLNIELFISVFFAFSGKLHYYLSYFIAEYDARNLEIMLNYHIYLMKLEDTTLVLPFSGILVIRHKKLRGIYRTV